MKIHQPAELIEDPNEALQMLKEGNERYLSGKLIHKDYCNSDREVYCCGQNPFAAVLTCSDSRIVPEIFFNQRLGDLFIIRNAGNIVENATLGSLELAAKFLKIKLVVVCGHSNCGAVEASCSNLEFTHNINHIIKHIKPAVFNGSSIDEVIHRNIINQAELIKADEILNNLGVMVVCAYFDIRSGAVTWL